VVVLAGFDEGNFLTGVGCCTFDHGGRVGTLEVRAGSRLGARPGETTECVRTENADARPGKRQESEDEVDEFAQACEGVGHEGLRRSDGEDGGRGTSWPVSGVNRTLGACLWVTTSIIVLAILGKRNIIGHCVLNRGGRTAMFEIRVIAASESQIEVDGFAGGREFTFKTMVND
jgi:hypothetical protein